MNSAEGGQNIWSSHGSLPLESFSFLPLAFFSFEYKGSYDKGEIS